MCIYVYTIHPAEADRNEGLNIYIYTYIHTYIHTIIYTPPLDVKKTVDKKWVSRAGTISYLRNEYLRIDCGHKTCFPGANLDENWCTLYSFLRRIRLWHSRGPVLNKKDKKWANKFLGWKKSEKWKLIKKYIEYLRRWNLGDFIPCQNKKLLVSRAKLGLSYHWRGGCIRYGIPYVTWNSV